MNNIYYFSRWLVLSSLLILGWGCGSGTSSQSSGPPAPTLILTPATEDLPAIPVGMTQAFTAVVGYPGGSASTVTGAATWSIANGTGTATVTPDGVVTGTSPGTVTVSASYAGAADSALLTVTTGTLAGVHVVPPVQSGAMGEAQAWQAYADFSDGSRFRLPSGVVWAATPARADGTVPVAVDASGLAVPTQAGAWLVTASYQGKTSAPATMVARSATLQDLTISAPPGELGAGTQVQLSATLTDSDGEQEDVTESTNFTASGAGKFESGPGLLTILNAGPIHVSAVYDPALQSELRALDPALSTIAATTVSTTADLQGIYGAPAVLSVEPAVLSLKVKESILLKVNETLAGQVAPVKPDLVAWTVTDPTVAVIDTKGNLTAQAVGTTEVKATVAGREAVAATVNVYRYVDLALTDGGSYYLYKGFCEHFTLYEVTTGLQNVTAQVTFAGYDSSVAELGIGAGPPDLPDDPEVGMIYGLKPGTTTFKVSYHGRTATGTVTVWDAKFEKLALEQYEGKGSVTLPMGQQETLLANFTLVDLGTGERFKTFFNDSCLWCVSDDKVLKVSNRPGSKGIVTPVNPGKAYVRAIYFTLDGSCVWSNYNIEVVSSAP